MRRVTLSEQDDRCQIAYGEAVRAVKHQSSSLDELQSRAGILLAAASIVLMLVLVPCMAPQSAAWGSTLVGSDLSNAPNANGSCATTSCTFLEVTTTPYAAVSSIDGVIVSWSTLGGSGGFGTHGSLRLRVMRDASGSFLLVRTGPTVTIPTSVANQVITTAVKPGLAISRNDYVGVDALDFSSSIAERTVGSSSFSYALWYPAPSDGTAPPPTAGPFTGVREMLYQATVEPDSDNDGFGDETQDQCPTNATIQSACGSAPPPNPPAADKTPPSQTISAKNRQKAGRLSIKERLSEAGTITATATVRVSNAAKLYRFKTAKRSLAAGVATTIQLTLSKKSLRAVRRALRRSAKLKARVNITARDAAGNASTKRLTVKLIQ